MSRAPSTEALPLSGPRMQIYTSPCSCWAILKSFLMLSPSGTSKRSSVMKGRGAGYQVRIDEEEAPEEVGHIYTKDSHKTMQAGVNAV
jgi:hypothetical protein